jgi:hypothetical protein
MDSSLHALLARPGVPPPGVRQVVAAAAVDGPGLAARCSGVLHNPLVVQVGSWEQ